MTALSALWLPVLLSAVLVFVASSIIHMALSWWHKDDWARVPKEDAVMDALRPFALPPGDYFMPRCENMKEMGSPEFAAKLAKGPVVGFTVMPNGPMRIGRSLALWFVYSLVVGFFAAYVAAHALPAGAHYLRVFQIVGVTAFLGYSLALWQMSIWYARSWGATVRGTIDGLAYALLTAGCFGWLWPK